MGDSEILKKSEVFVFCAKFHLSYLRNLSEKRLSVYET